MIARARSTDAPPRSSLTASQPASLMNRWALRDRLLVRVLVGAERHVADEERRLQAPPGGGGEHQHLVHPDRDGRVVTEDGHRPGVADEDDVDARLLGDLGRREVVGGDHRDRLAQLLHLADPRDRDLGSFVRRRVRYAWWGAHQVSCPSSPIGRGSMITLSIRRASPIWAATAIRAGRPLKVSIGCSHSASRISRYSGSISGLREDPAGRGEHLGRGRSRPGGAPCGLERPVQRRSALAVGGGEVGIPRGHRQAVGLADRRAHLDPGRKVEVTDHAAEPRAPAGRPSGRSRRRRARPR